MASCRMVSNTGCSSPGELEMTFRTSELAVCCCSAAASCSRASASSRVRMLTCPSRSARVELTERASGGALLRLGLIALVCCAFPGLRLIGLALSHKAPHLGLRPLLTHHGSLVLHSKTGRSMSASGQLRPIDDVRGVSAIPLIATEMMHRGKRRKGPLAEVGGASGGFITPTRRVTPWPLLDRACRSLQ